MKTNFQDILSIETSTCAGSIALIRNKNCIAEIFLDINTTHLSKNLFIMVKNILEYTNLSYSSISGIAVSKGPGSFTSLKIGIAMAKSIAFSLNIPVFSVPTFEIMVENIYGQLPPKIQPFIDARKGEVYTAIFHWNQKEKKYIRASPDINVKIPLFISNIKSPTLIIGKTSLFEQDKSLKKILYKNKNIILGKSEFIPKASHIAALLDFEIKKGDQLNLLSLSPCYVRKYDMK